MHEDEFNQEFPPFQAFRFPPNPAPRITPEPTCAINPYFLPGTKNMMSYVWLNNNQAFWVFPVAFEEEYIHGYYWDGSRWVPSSIPKEIVYAFF